MPPRNLPTVHFHTVSLWNFTPFHFSLIPWGYKTTPTKLFSKIQASLIQQCPVSTLDFYWCFILKSPKQKSFFSPHILFFLPFTDTIKYRVTEARGPRFILASSHLQHLSNDFSSLRERYRRKSVEKEWNLSSPLTMTPPSMAYT